MALQGAALGFEPGDVEGLRDALIRLWREPALGPSLTENAARFVEPLAPDNAIPGYEQVVRTAISLNPRRR